MEPRKLEELLNDVDIVYVNSLDRLSHFVVNSISTDTRSLKRNELFIALKGERYDGNQFIERAVELGSSGVIFEMKSFDSIKKVVNKYPDRIFIGVNDTLDVYSKMAKNYLRKFNTLKKLAITGSSGKTTMRGLLSSVLSAKYRTVASEKSYNNLVGVSKTIFSINDEHEFYIQEMGTNHPGEIAKLVEIVRPNAGLITNIGPAHIGYFGSIENIAREKKELFLSLDEDDIAFINSDDPFSSFLSDNIKANVIYFGVDENRDIEVKNIDLNESLFLYKDNEIKLHLPGRHNILNAAGAITVGIEYEIPIEQIKEAIETYNAEAGRGLVIEIDSISIIDESYNANPLSVKASIDYFSEIACSGKKILVLGDMAELGSYSEKYHREIASYLIDSDINYIYTIGNETFFTYEECSKRMMPEIKHFYQTDSLIRELIGKLKNGDMILIKGSRIMGLDRLIRNLKVELSNR